MQLRVQIQCGWLAALFSVYAPINQTDESVITFPKAFSIAILSIQNDKLIIFDDFYVSVGRDFDIWNRQSQYDIGKVYANSLKLLELCSEFNLIITSKNLYKRLYDPPKIKTLQ